MSQINIKYMHSHYEVDISNDKAELYEKIVSVQLVGHCYYIFQALSRYTLFNAR